MPADNTVLIWRTAMLGGSETFVRRHGDALTRWRPVFAGTHKVESPVSRDTDRIVFPGSFRTLRLTGWSPRLRRTIAAVRPDVVHAHFGGDGFFMAGNVGRTPLVVTLHGYDVTKQPATPGLLGVRYRRNLRTVFRRADLLLPVSRFIAGRAIALGADPAKVRVHHLGVPLPAQVPDVPKRWDVVFVGRFVAKKGVDDLIEALTPGQRALLIGDGPLRAAAAERAAARGLDVTFAGAVPPDQVQAEVAAARILAAPSKVAADGDCEGLPTTVVEAAALGVPVVATRHSGIPEVVVHGETGLLSAESDPAALAAGIAALLADDARRAALGKAARAHAEEHFDQARQTLVLERIYDDLVSGGAAS